MILVKEYVSLATAAMKMGKRHFYSDHSNGCYKGKHTSLGKSRLNHLGHVTLSSWIYEKFLPVVGIIGYESPENISL